MHWLARLSIAVPLSLSGVGVTSSSRAQEEATGPAVGSLADTTWRLVELQSMDDAVGVQRPEDASVYTMTLNADGSVNMRLDCNRGRGTWSAEPAGDGSSGSFELGPLAMTRAVCPPPSLDEPIARQAEWIRTYLLRDGRLHLSLMADGGIQVWEPLVAGRFRTDPDAAIEDAILQASPDYTSDIVGPDDPPARYVYSRVDLNDDGREEVLVYLMGPFFCGSGGCNLLLFRESAEGYSLVSEFPISRETVIVSPIEHAGWNDLIRLESGGGASPAYVTHRFDGTTYVEEQRVPADTAPDGTLYLAGGFTYTDGVVLAPTR